MNEEFFEWKGNEEDGKRLDEFIDAHIAVTNESVWLRGHQLLEFYHSWAEQRGCLLSGLMLTSRMQQRGMVRRTVVTSRDPGRGVSMHFWVGIMLKDSTEGLRPKITQYRIENTLDWKANLYDHDYPWTGHEALDSLEKKLTLHKHSLAEFRPLMQMCRASVTDDWEFCNSVLAKVQASVDMQKDLVNQLEKELQEARKIQLPSDEL